MVKVAVKLIFSDALAGIGMALKVFITTSLLSLPATILIQI